MKMKMKKKMKPSRDKYLPPELMREVLARLPAKTLMKFRCVCKTWCSLIDSSDFISLHSNVHNNNNNTQLLLAWQHLKRKGYILTVRLSDSFKTIRNLGRIPKSRPQPSHSFHACNGLMLIIEYVPTRIMLWNPSIGKSLMLPVAPMNDGVRYHLGFAPSSNDYKVLAVDYHKVAAIYSLNDDCWRVILDGVGVQDCGLSFLSRRTRVVSCGGALYWVSGIADKLFSFNFDVEEFSPVQLPDSVKESRVWFIFRISDSIAVFTMSSENSCIWVMEKDGGEDPWRLWFSGEPNSDICNLLKPKSVASGISSVLYLQKSNTFLIAYWRFAPWTVTGSNRERVVSYNITSQEIQHLGKSIRGQISFDTYVESLVFHKGFEGRRVESFP